MLPLDIMSIYYPFNDNTVLIWTSLISFKMVRIKLLALIITAVNWKYRDMALMLNDLVKRKFVGFLVKWW